MTTRQAREWIEIAETAVFTARGFGIELTPELLAELQARVIAAWDNRGRLIAGWDAHHVWRSALEARKLAGTI